MQLAAHPLLVLAVVVIGMAGCGSDAASSDPAVAAPEELLVAHATGDTVEVPWADTVTYSLAGEQVARFDAASADRPRTWVGCPPGMGEYEGRDCPVSPLRTIAYAVRHDEGIVPETSVPTTVGCNRYPSEIGDASTVWIRPDRDHRDCFSDFAVAVSLDESARISSVDLTLSGP